jgi:eukaryotic-like serine/threonine-protein kinase
VTVSATPTAIGKYQVVERVGQGGMGTLYLARDPALDRLVAIKVLSADYTNDELRARFSREARSVSRLSHPNIVTIFEYGDFAGQPYIAMEYIAGESVAELISRRAPVPLHSKLQMMEDLCAGMAYAHRAKIVHRDIKPPNLMISAGSGRIKILDFGIARSLESGSTRTTQVLGTPSYMSPEQAKGQSVDYRGDVFAIGAVFYELLAYRGGNCRSASAGGY